MRSLYSTSIREPRSSSSTPIIQNGFTTVSLAPMAQDGSEGTPSRLACIVLYPDGDPYQQPESGWSRGERVLCDFPTGQPGEAVYGLTKSLVPESWSKMCEQDIGRHLYSRAQDPQPPVHNM